MKQSLYLIIAMLPAFSYAMEKEKQPASLQERRRSLPNIIASVGNLFKKKSSAHSSTVGSIDMEHLDNESLESGSSSIQSPRTCKSEGAFSRNTWLTRSSDTALSPRSKVAFNGVVTVRTDGNIDTQYEMDAEGKLSPIYIGSEDDDASISSPSIQYPIDPDGRKNPHYKNPKGRRCKSPDTLSDEIKSKVLGVEDQCPVGRAVIFASPSLRRKTVQRRMGTLGFIAEEDEEEIPTYRIGCDEEVGSLMMPETTASERGHKAEHDSFDDDSWD